VVLDHPAGGERPTGLEAPKAIGKVGSRPQRTEGHRQRGRRRATVPRQGGTAVRRRKAARSEAPGAARGADAARLQAPAESSPLPQAEGLSRVSYTPRPY